MRITSYDERTGGTGMKMYQMLIGGHWTGSVTGRSFSVIDPATRQEFARVPRSGRKDVDRAVSSAEAAFPVWSGMPVKERAELLRRAGELIGERADFFVDCIVRELGMPRKYCRTWQVDGSAEEAVYFADMAENYRFEQRSEPGILRREPMGVVAVVTPWNYPLDQITLKAFPALAAGNCVIVKPSRQTPVTALELGRVLQDAGFPDGVFNVVTGIGDEIGACLAQHPNVRSFSFTGSTKVGKKLGSLAVESNAKNVILEMGGKSALILLRGGDVRKAVNEAASSAFLNSGQTCCAFTRMLIPREMTKEVEQELQNALGGFKVGDPAKPDTDIGPVVSEGAYEKICGYIRSGLEEGARMLKQPAEAPEEGWYVSPVVFMDASMEMRIAREEIFGPVLTVIPYDEVSEAVRLANQSEYGLDGAIFGPPDEALMVARRLQCGNVHINGAVYDVSMPFGGYKQSGIGREGGREGFEGFLETKSIFL